MAWFTTARARRPIVGEVAIDGDRIGYVGPHAQAQRRAPSLTPKARHRARLHQHAGPPGGIAVRRRAGAERSRQGVTLEVHGRGLHGSANATMQTLWSSGRATSSIPSTGRTLGGYLETLRDGGHRARMSPPSSARARCEPIVLASATCSRRPSSSTKCARWCSQAMEQGAARGDDGADLCAQHLRQDARTDRARAGVGALRRHLHRPHAQRRRPHSKRRLQETIDIAKASGAPAEIYHLKHGRQATTGASSMRGHRHDRDGARLGHAHHRRHVHLYGRRDRARCGHAALGAGRRPGSLDRAAARTRRSAPR